MSLPKIKHPLYPITIPSSRKETTFRPFTVKEEKILLTAQESKDMDQMILAVKQIVNNCVTDIDVEYLAPFDFDYLLLQIRGKSVSNVMEFSLVDPDEKQQIDISVDVEEIKVYYPEGHSTNINLDNGFIIAMRYPKIEQFYRSVTQKSQIEKFRFMVDCVQYVVDGDELYKFEDYSEEEILEFFDGLTGSDIKKISDFFETMPRLRMECNYEIGDKKKTFVLQGLETFFQSR